MSLVNDMLRDLEERRAGASRQLQRDGLLAVDEAGAERRERVRRFQRNLIGLGLVIIVGLPLGLLVDRLVKSHSPAQSAPAIAVAAVPLAAVQAPTSAQILEVLPQNDSNGLVLKLLIDRSAAYQRRDENGLVMLDLPGAQLNTSLGVAMREGRLQRDGRSLSWKVQTQGQNVQVVLTGLGDNLQVRDRLEPAGNNWLLRIEVPMPTKATIADAADTPMGSDNTAANEPATVDTATDEAPLPAWANAPVLPAERQPRTATVVQAAKPLLVSGPPQMKITPYQPDALTVALQVLQSGDYPRAISELKALQLSRGKNLDVIHGLARAYLADGQQALLLTWLPLQLKQWPNDSELRLLLARSQLQSGDARNAVTTLEQNPPTLAQDPTYYALLAASYQQTAQWQKSAGLYEQLTQLRPTQAAWQLGLGIALERLSQPAEAARHYRYAERGQGLDDGARRFAGERAVALGGK
ncbi:MULTISPECIES: tetratricopeptide repeat protein [unclassified Pseudomonas]|uniref:tetratricopeptide repeat protein n=1 Tax=unclassified Pseudomonas TaxID=196821 RepID=UPI002B239C34|nr:MULTISPECIES: tetratricopeptide repeat protein [unclassified Pseudomonas]MEA9978748.1 tetratricopeptide repeat protein [Pseudomonas sp. RTS4]MEB0199560.1 tetratricopeptide repeat protein [Pseudomonas sp. 5S4]MEB0245649.1 tetratricopeptide repeat protein [Pseudomonas sp. 10S5]